MQCTVGPCTSPLLYKGGENKEDYGCHNDKCRSYDIQYYPNVKVRSGWYYAAGYNLPFEYIDTHWERPDYNFHWYALVSAGSETHLQGLKLIDRCGIPSWNKKLQDYSATTYKECAQETLYSIPYYALPTNQDFNTQFNFLRDKMMKEWFALYRDPKKQNPYTVPPFDPFGWNDWYDFASRVKTTFQNTTGGIVIDDKTQQLIELAANNTNDNEAKNAALTACKRLRKLLKP